MTEGYGRILDANLNRVAEGLRVLEEAVRFLQSDAGTYAEIRDLRHTVRELGRVFPEAELLRERDSLADVGADAREERHSDLPALIRANLRRVEEGLRVLEEFSRLAAPELALRFKELRYRSYALEKGLLLLSEEDGR